MSVLAKLFGRSAGSAPAPAPTPAPAPPSAEEWRKRGNSALAAGSLAEAADCYRSAATADPRDALARLNLGYVLLQQGDARGAQSQLEEALRLRQPDQHVLHDIHYMLAIISRTQGDEAAAIRHLQIAIEAQPAFAQAVEELIQLLHETRSHEQALQWARRLHDIRPDIDSELIVAQQLHHVGRHAEALASLDDILERAAGHAPAWTGRGNVLNATGRNDEAVEAFERALALVGPMPDALANLAGALSRMGRFEEALKRVDEALSHDPAHLEALCNRLNILTEMVRLDEALQAGRGALAMHPGNPEAHWNLAIACLLAGRFDEGWREHEWRWETKAGKARRRLTNEGRQWSGAEDLQGRTILLFAEQGLGDSIQMLRYVPLVAKRGARILLHLPIGLHGLDLVRDVTHGVTLVPPGSPLPPFDFHCSLMSLPLAFGSDEATIPRDVPYLGVNAGRAEHWRRRIEAAGAGKRLKVGLVWSGNANHGNDSNRSIALSAIRALSVAGCFYVSLQQEVRPSDRACAEEWSELHRWGEELVDFDDTAALVAALDLVISVDTSVAHLAGALARPTWILLPHCPDWRWMVGRDDSPWYPSARLFRQPKRGDWPSVMQCVRDELRGAVAQLGSDVETAAVCAARPSWPELLDRAQQQSTNGEAVAALDTLEAACSVTGSHPLTEQARGNVLFGLGRYTEAAQAFESALARKPDLRKVAEHAASAWWRAGRMDLALARVDDVLRLGPPDVQNMLLRANALQMLGRHPEAIEAARDAHRKFPESAEAEWTYGAIALAAGDCEQGWPPIEARWRLPGAGTAPDPKVLGCPAWTGREPLAGRTMLLLAEQGFGDIFQFVRYASEVRRRGARVVLLVRDPVLELLRGSLPDCQVVTRLEDAPRADFHIAMMSLPGALRTTLATIPAEVPYLRADAKRVQHWRERLPRGRGPRVGVVWSGNPAQANDRNRSMELERFMRIEVPGIQFVNLQRDVRDSDSAALQRSNIWDPSADLHSFSDTAALVESLDLVVSVCTGVAHLAGAMGKPLSVLLACRADWRWLVGRDDSPWYPSARLFRQSAPGDWDAPLDAVRAQLEALAATQREVA